MAKLKTLIKEIHDTGTIYPRDIYNLYYLEFVSSRYPEVVRTPYGQEIQSYYLGQLKEKYLKLFKYLLSKQIAKYVSRKRIDPDFDVSMLQNPSTSDLKTMMAKTFRSDMKRRNDVWNAVADYTHGLEHSTSPSQIFVNINGLNNAIHNTGGKIMLDPMKISNYSELHRAFETADKVKSSAQWELLKGLVDKDIRDLLSQEMQEGRLSPEEKKKIAGTISDNDRVNPTFMAGVRDALQDKNRGEHPRDLEGHSEDYIRGYSIIPKESMWNKVNDKLTQWVSDFGRSYGNRR